MTYQKGRGATENPASRYIAATTQPVDDGWDLPEEPRSAPSTEFFADRTVKIITRNKSPDVPFDRSINAYKGCEHGCVYCFARPTHAYLDLSPGLDFETKIFYKTNVREHLIDELARPRYRCATIAMGTNTDPYQPVERRLEITREVLEVVLECRHPVSIVTKSHMVLRDVDLLSELAQLRLVSVILSVTTLSNELKTKMEPRTASPAARLRTIGKLRDAGIPVGAMMAPVIPFVNDHELEAIVEASVSAGVSGMQYVLLRLPLEVKDLFEAWLVEHYPLKAERVMSVIRDTRGGKAYDSTWGQRMSGKGAFAELIRARFNNALRKYGLQDSELPQLRTDLFQPPSRATPQLSLW